MGTSRTPYGRFLVLNTNFHLQHERSAVLIPVGITNHLFESVFGQVVCHVEIISFSFRAQASVQIHTLQASGSSLSKTAFTCWIDCSCHLWLPGHFLR